MNDRLPVDGQLSYLTTWPMVALLFALLWLFQIGFGVRTKYIGPAPDGLGWYTPHQLHDILEGYGPSGRNVYAITELTLDVLFPPIYTGLFAGLLARVYRRRIVSWVALAPLLALVFDLAENVQLSYFAWTFQDDFTPWSYYAAASTAAKFVCTAVSILLLLVGAILSRSAKGF